MTNLDIAQSAFRGPSKSKNQAFLCTDATIPCGLRSNTFDFVLEKGTLDAVMSDDSKENGHRKSIALLSEISRLMSPSGTAFLVSHSPSRDNLISAANLEIHAVHRCFLSDEAIIINTLRTTGSDAPLAEKLGMTTEAVEAFKEVKDRIAKKRLAAVMRKFMKGWVGSDERQRGGVRTQTDNPRKQDVCWIYILRPKTTN